VPSGPPAPQAWRSPDLGTRRELRLAQGWLSYHERGSGPPILFVHGWLANANLWRKVVPLLAATHRCITPDFPFGSHSIPLDDSADLTPPGCGRLISSVVEALGLSDVTLVGNDSGGAYSQIATAAAPAAIRRLALNSCETPYDTFPPPAFAALKRAAANRETLLELLSPLESREVRATPAAYGRLAKRPIDDVVSDTYALPALRDARILRDASKVMKSADERYVEAAGQALIRNFSRPVAFFWSKEDHFFPLENAHRYAAELADGRVELVSDAFSFTPEDQPEQLARLLQRFAET
jgi:pimeloyl-ACP methyl ester carboxylesterase